MNLRFARVLLILPALIALAAEARWAVKEDVEYLIESEDARYSVSADGTYKLTVERTLEVLKESAKSSVGVQAIYYSGSSSSVKVLTAETVNGPTSTPVPPNMIENKDVGSSQLGFDDQKQMMIVFPNVKVGSKLHYKYEMDVKKVPVPGFFAERFFPGTETYVKEYTAKVESALPLYVKSYDTKHMLLVANGASDGKHTLLVRIKEPMLWQPIAEPGAVLDRDSVPRVEASSAVSWSDMAPKLREGFENVIKGKLPPSFEKIAMEAKSKAGAEAKAQLVMARLSETLNYLGDWRSVGGKFTPREFSAVESSKHADCKDMSAATVAILRAAGAQADVALVYRGDMSGGSWAFQLITQSAVPDLGIFNHAIVRVKDGGRTLWLDPTNSTAYAKGLRDDVADRPALVLAEGVKELDHTEALKPDTDVVALEKDIHFGDRLSLEASGNVTFKGRAAAAAAAMSLSFNHNKTNVEQLMLKILASESLVRWWTIDTTPLETRLVSDFRVPFKYGAEGASFLTSAGPAYNLKAADRVRGLMVLPDRVSDLHAGSPGTLERTFRFHDIEMIGSQTVECYVKSRWVEATRNTMRVPHGLEVKERIVFKEAVIPRSDLATPEFAKVQAELNRCFGETAIVFRQKERLPEVEGRKLAALDGSGNELVTKDAAKRWIEDWVYDAKPILRSKEYFEKELAEKPESVEAHFWLARAVFLLGHVRGDEYSRDHIELAIATVDKALALKADLPELLALNAYFWVKAGDRDKAQALAAKAMEKGAASAIVHWAMAHVQDSRKDTNGAIASFGKAIQIAGKKDAIGREARHDLGRFYLRELDWRPSEENLKAALSASPLNVRYMLSLADLYVKQGELAKAEPLLKKAIDIKDNAVIRAYLAGVLLGQSAAYMKARYTLPKAEEYIKKSLTYLPDSHEAYFMLARIQEAKARENRDMKAWKKALEFFGRAAALKPGFEEALKKAKEIRDYLVDIGELDGKEAARAPAATGASAPPPGQQAALPIAPDLNAGSDPAPKPAQPQPEIVIPSQPPPLPDTPATVIPQPGAG